MTIIKNKVLDEPNCNYIDDYDEKLTWSWHIQKEYIRHTGWLQKGCKYPRSIGTVEPQEPYERPLDLNPVGDHDFTDVNSPQSLGFSQMNLEDLTGWLLSVFVCFGLRLLIYVYIKKLRAFSWQYVFVVLIYLSLYTVVVFLFYSTVIYWNYPISVH